jgi:hypothetical protein
MQFLQRIIETPAASAALRRDFVPSENSQCAIQATSPSPRRPEGRRRSRDAVVSRHSRPDELPSPSKRHRTPLLVEEQLLKVNEIAALPTRPARDDSSDDDASFDTTMTKCRIAQIEAKFRAHRSVVVMPS